MSEEKKKFLDLSMLKRVFAYANPYMGYFYLALGMTILMGVLSPIRPLIISFMVDDYVLKGDTDGLLYWTIVVVALLVIETLITFAMSYTSSWLGQTIVNDMREQLFRHMLRFKIKYFDNSPVGRAVTRIVSDMEAISDIFSDGIITILGDLLKLIVVIILMFYINWKFSLLVLIPIPILFKATSIFRNAIKNAYQLESTAVGRLNSFVQERLSGMNIVQIFNRQKVEQERFKDINAAHREAHIRSVWAYSIFFPVVEILSSLSIAFLILYAAYRVYDDGLASIDLLQNGKGSGEGQLFAFILWINMLYRPIRMLADKFNVLQRGMVRAKRVFEVFDTNEKIEEGTEEIAENFSGEVHFNNVFFAYKDDDYVLKDITFHAKPGQKLAFVGATGAGKSTIINLLSRFYEFQKGEILLDGKDIKSFKNASIRENIGVVLQDVFLFSDTIHNNITLNNDDITREDVIDAAKKVGAHEFIMKLPGNYDYDVKERGGVLSTGQRQLIAFIRAYVYNPTILVLDEATSSIDTDTELLIQNATDVLTKGRTSIIIAHRLSTIEKADKIIVMEKGRIVESGSHSELIELEGYYRKLHDIQFQ